MEIREKLISYVLAINNNKVIKIKKNNKNKKDLDKLLIITIIVKIDDIIVNYIIIISYR